MDSQLAFALGLVAAGAVLVVIGIALRPIWRVAVRPFYRQPDAQEPSEVGWRARTAVLVVAGIATIVGGGLLAASFAADAPSDAEAQASTRIDRCDEIVDAVDRPSSQAEADAAIQDAAAAAGLDVDREDSETEESVPVPTGEDTVVIEQTRWTVVDGETVVAAFTWTSAEGGAQGRFSAEACG